MALVGFTDAVQYDVSNVPDSGLDFTQVPYTGTNIPDQAPPTVLGVSIPTYSPLAMVKNAWDQYTNNGIFTTDPASYATGNPQPSMTQNPLPSIDLSGFSLANLVPRVGVDTSSLWALLLLAFVLFAAYKVL